MGTVLIISYLEVLNSIIGISVTIITGNKTTTTVSSNSKAITAIIISINFRSYLGEHK
jgi:hypothetical protein